MDKIIQKSTNPIFKQQAIKVLAKLGGNNRNFLEKSSPMKHEKSTQSSITLDFVISNNNNMVINLDSIFKIIMEIIQMVIH